MTPAPQVRSSAYFPFVEFMERAGTSVENGLEEALVSAIVLRDPEALVPVHLAHSFLSRSARAVGLSDFGFVVGRDARINDLGAFGRNIGRSLTLHDALGRVRSKFPLYSSAERVEWSRVNEKVLFCHRYTQETGVGSQYGQQCALLLMRDIVRLAAGPTWQPAEVFAMPTMDISAIQTAFDGAHVRRAAWSGFVFPAGLLSLPFVHTWRDRKSNDDIDLETFETSAPAGDFVGSVKQVIASLLRHGRFKLSDIAEAVAHQPRTLQRRLSEAEVEFSEILSEVRFELALTLMNDPSLRVIDIAHELGYADQSNFTRAFRQWTGVTPREFRRLQCGES